jgi:hypothetical protein
MEAFTEELTMEEAGRQYEKGLACLTAARKIMAAAKGLEIEEREEVRRLADGLVAKGTDLLTAVVNPTRRRRQPASGMGGQ